MKTRTRLTKAAVLKEIKTLRKAIKDYAAMGLDDLQAEYDNAFPAERGQKKSHKDLMQGLLIAATYYLTNVLDLE